MKAKTITYSRLISKGNYENEKIEICLGQIEDAELIIAKATVNDDDLPF